MRCIRRCNSLIINVSCVVFYCSHINTHNKAQPRITLSGPLVSSDALARPFPGCVGLTLHLLCQCVCMSLSPHTAWLTQTGLLTGPAAKIETHTHHAQSHTYAHTQGASVPLTLLYMSVVHLWNLKNHNIFRACTSHSLHLLRTVV